MLFTDMSLDDDHHAAASIIRMMTLITMRSRCQSSRHAVRT